MVCKCYCCSSNLMLSRVSCICVFGAQFLVPCFQILLIPGLEQSSPRQSTALAIPGAKHTHNALLFMEIHTDLFCMHSELSTNTTPFPQATGRMWFEGHGCFIWMCSCSSKDLLFSCWVDGTCILEDSAQPCPKSHSHFSKVDNHGAPGCFSTFYP